MGSMKKPGAKDRILETASRLFHRMGYACVGINEIIGRSETAKASFYQHFPTKQALCAAWLRQTHERSAERCEAILSSPEPPLEKLAAYFDDLATYLRKSEFRGCPYTNTAAVVKPEESELIQEIRLHKAGQRSFFQRLAGQCSGNDEPDLAMGDILFLLYSGAAIEAQNIHESWPVDSAKRAALDLFEKGP